MRQTLLIKYFDSPNLEEELSRQKLSTSISADPSKRDLDVSERKNLQRYEIQCELNNQGASDLVVDLFMNDASHKIFKEIVLLAIALLEGGNSLVQVRFAFRRELFLVVFCLDSDFSIFRKQFTIG
jgi:hypothetical protein